MCVCACVWCVGALVCTCVHLCVLVCTCVYLCVYVRMRVYMCVCVCVCDCDVKMRKNNIKFSTNHFQNSLYYFFSIYTSDVCSQTKKII